MFVYTLLSVTANIWVGQRHAFGLHVIPYWLNRRYSFYAGTAISEWHLRLYVVTNKRWFYLHLGSAQPMPCLSPPHSENEMKTGLKAQWTRDFSTGPESDLPIAIPNHVAAAAGDPLHGVGAVPLVLYPSARLQSVPSSFWWSCPPVLQQTLDAVFCPRQFLYNHPPGPYMHALLVERLLWYPVVSATDV